MIGCDAQDAAPPQTSTLAGNDGDPGAPDLTDQPQGPGTPENATEGSSGDLVGVNYDAAVPVGACFSTAGRWYRSGLIVGFANGRFECRNGRWYRSASNGQLYYMCYTTTGNGYLSGRTIRFRNGIFYCSNGVWVRVG
jgi:hypothetical protein